MSRDGKNFVLVKPTARSRGSRAGRGAELGARGEAADGGGGYQMIERIVRGRMVSIRPQKIPLRKCATVPDAPKTALR